uniref:Uncharacterized protein n=1 Tax=Bigelowiella natans TaxID=227086 RepID=A0A7S2P678_BIGNA|mmetsp:Transcript_461/g.677  ORF Transcript_461/g.677 Transcript_461/m.677 type:complete len:409 (+) Transcript_461:160-1386(+)
MHHPDDDDGGGDDVRTTINRNNNNNNSKARILLSPLSSHKGRKKKNGGPTTSLLSSPSLSSLSSAQLLPIMSPSSSLLPVGIHGAKSNITYDSPSPHHRSRDDPRSKSQFFHDLSLKMERKDYSASAFFNSSVTSMHEFVNLLGDGRALSKNVLVTRNFDKLVPERISASRFIDIWLLDENCVKSWNAFEKQALLIVEMAHILLKNKVWGSQCQTRIVMPVKSNTDELELTVSPPSGKSSAVFHSSTPLHESGSVDAKLLKTEVILEEVEPSEGDKMLQHGGDNDDGDDDDEKEPVEAAKSMLEQRLYQARINIDRIMVIPISQEDLLSDSGYSTSSMPPPSKLNRMIRERSASTLLSLLPLPPLPKNLSSASKECDKYYRVLGEISQGLPPVALLSESDDLIMSREI